MKRMRMLMYVALAILLTNTSLMAGVPINVQIGDLNLSPNDDFVNLSNSDGSARLYSLNGGSIQIKISGLGGQPARVIAGDGSPGGKDGTEDTLKIVNAVITPVTTQATEIRIAFWGTFNDLPKTADGAYYYKVQGPGNFKNTNLPPIVSNNTVRYRGSVQVPATTGAWYQITGADLSNTVNSGNFNFFSAPSSLAQQFPQPDVNGPRGLMGQFWFTLKHIKDVITISSTGMPVKDSSQPGQGEDTFSIPQPTCDGTKCPSGLTACTPKANVGFWCRFLGIGCPNICPEDVK